MIGKEIIDDSQIKERIGESLKRCRKNFNQTQGAVAEGLGILQQTYYKNEAGRAVPSALIIFKLAEHYNVSADYLLGLSDEPRPLNPKIEVQEVSPVAETTEDTQSLKAEIQSLKEQVAVLQLAVAKLAG